MSDTEENKPQTSAPLSGDAGKGGALNAKQTIRLARWLVTNQPLVKRAWLGKCSPRQAIKAQCLDCVGEDRQAVADCGDRCCPLWQFRPYQKNRKI